MVLKSFNFGKLQLLEDVLASQILTLDIFTHMQQQPPPPPITPIAPPVTTLLQVL